MSEQVANGEGVPRTLPFDLHGELEDAYARSKALCAEADIIEQMMSLADHESEK